MIDRQTIEEGKTLAIVAYITFIGLFIAIFMNMEKKNPYVAFHARQMLGLIIMLLVSNVCERYVNSWFGTMLWFVTFGSWLYCLFFAIKGETKELPVLGSYFQNAFRNINS